MATRKSSAPVARPRRTPARRPQSQPPEPAAAPALTVFGFPAREIDVLPISSLNLLMSVGEVAEGGEVLVPYVELRLRRDAPGAAEEETQDAFASTITFENTAFLLMDLVSDFARVSRQLAQLSQGAMGPEAVRMAYSLACLENARSELDGCIEAVRSIPAANG